MNSPGKTSAEFKVTQKNRVVPPCFAPAKDTIDCDAAIPPAPDNAKVPPPLVDTSSPKPVPT